MNANINNNNSKINNLGIIILFVLCCLCKGKMKQFKEGHSLAPSTSSRMAIKCKVQRAGDPHWSNTRFEAYYSA